MRPLVLALGFLFASWSLHAQDFNDGGVHTVSGPAGPITVSGGTTVTIVSGASVIEGVTVGPSSNLNMQGGNVLGADGFGPAAVGRCWHHVAGDLLGHGRRGPGGSSVDNSGHGGYALVSAGQTQITGGTYLGGAGSSDSGIGGTALSTSLGNLQITGGTFTGGIAARDGNGAYVDGGQGDRGSISGGIFTGTNSLVFWGTGNAELDISGGTYQGIINALLLGTSSIHFLGSNFQYDAGTGSLTGELASGNTLDVTLQSTTPYAVSEGTSQVVFTDADPPPTPEPATIILLATGTLAILLRRLGRRSKR